MVAAGVPAQIGDLNAAINKAGRERMLSQRLAKAYFQIGLDVDTERSRAVLQASMAAFDRQLAELKAFAPTPGIRATYQQLEVAWLAYRQLLADRAPNEQSARAVLVLSDRVLALAHQGTAELQALAATRGSRFIDVSGRQRMLSQRMAKLHQALQWGVQAPDSAASLEAARQEFVAMHRELSAAPANSAAIRQALQMIDQQWPFFDSALAAGASGGGRRAALDVATTSERILQQMELVVELYEKAAR